MAANNNRMKNLTDSPTCQIVLGSQKSFPMKTLTNTWSSAIRQFIESVRTVVPMSATSKIPAICKPSATLRLMTAPQS